MRITYAKTQRSERAKLATLGVDNRSTATTILAVRALVELQSDSTLKAEARKLLSFTDNRQDASLQAGTSTTSRRLRSSGQDCTRQLPHEDLRA